ncbi:MAG: RtcB family protein, partial [Gammaproteobacteria bacterium]
MTTPYEVLHEPGRHPIKSWTRGISFDDNSKKQLQNLATLPFIHKWIAVMPDVHLGKGATIGSVIPTLGAVIPAAVGVDLGCGMIAAKTSLTADQLPDSLEAVRSRIETLVPHGLGKKSCGGRDKGSWDEPPADVANAWTPLEGRFARLCVKHPFLKNTNNLAHLGTLGTGNHFIEICLDENDAVWIMLHSGSRG